MRSYIKCKTDSRSTFIYHNLISTRYSIPLRINSEQTDVIISLYVWRIDPVQLQSPLLEGPVPVDPSIAVHREEHLQHQEPAGVKVVNLRNLPGVGARRRKPLLLRHKLLHFSCFSLLTPRTESTKHTSWSIVSLTSLWESLHSLFVVGKSLIYITVCSRVVH